MADNPEKLRLDLLLVQTGHFESREKAQRAIMAGQVRVGGHAVSKPGTVVSCAANIEVLGGEKYVGRGGLKLEAALDHFGIDPAGWLCLDIGASTGGFTDCLLQRGARHVVAVDVGHNQLDWKIRQDARVTVFEGVNARYLGRDEVPESPDLMVADVSFISLSLILPPAFALLKPDGVAIVLIKPQFELEKGQVGKGGIVTDEALRLMAVEKIRRFVLDAGHQWIGYMDSPISGAKGNREFLACLRP